MIWHNNSIMCRWKGDFVSNNKDFIKPHGFTHADTV